MKTKIQTQDRTDRILTLRLTGIVGNEDEVKLRILALATEKLKVPLTSDDFHVQALLRASAEPNQVKGPPTFLLKFNNVWRRHEIYTARLKLRGTNIYISENLDREKQRLFYQCHLLRKQNVIEQTWSRDLKIYVRTKTGTVIEVKDQQTLNDVGTHPNTTELTQMTTRPSSPMLSPTSSMFVSSPDVFNSNWFTGLTPQDVIDAENKLAVSTSNGLNPFESPRC